MSPQNVAVGLGGLGVLVLIVWSVSTATSQEAVPPDMTDAEGRLAVGVMAYGEEWPKTCYFDAEVKLEDGKVATVELEGQRAEDRIEPGDEIADLPADMMVGATIPIPVNIGDEGKLYPGYAYCEEERQ